MFSEKNISCAVYLGKTEYFIPNLRTTKNGFEELCKVFKGKPAVFSKEMFYHENSTCLTNFQLLVRQTNSTNSKITLVAFDFDKFQQKDVVEGVKFKVLCTKKLNNSKTSTSTTQSSLSVTDILIITISIASFILLAVSLTY